MPTNILMPALSPTMETGNIVKWYVAAGDKVLPGDLLAEIETDKATMELESIDEGIVTKIVIEEGTQGISVNEVIAIISTNINGTVNTQSTYLNPVSNSPGLSAYDAVILL